MESSNKKYQKLMSRLSKYANLTGNCQIISIINDKDKLSLNEKNDNKIKIKSKM